MRHFQQTAAEHIWAGLDGAGYHGTEEGCRCSV